MNINVDSVGCDSLLNQIVDQSIIGLLMIIILIVDYYKWLWWFIIIIKSYDDQLIING